MSLPYYLKIIPSSEFWWISPELCPFSNHLPIMCQQPQPSCFHELLPSAVEFSSPMLRYLNFSQINKLQRSLSLCLFSNTDIFFSVLCNQTSKELSGLLIPPFLFLHFQFCTLPSTFLPFIHFSSEWHMPMCNLQFINTGWWIKLALPCLSTV